ncbi:HNH endonuclease [Rhodococcus aetherivorans]|uniref:HNH endonuclease n=1 Tax=Rhodococcus aetherivorans TaxID=191292 RepID=UPI00045C4938|nr:HNH endonuclease [Rhodococcus aetherivorans]KDE12428.1 hypothetical protein N505_0115380 [Rhodococcus aetherivorans]
MTAPERTRRAIPKHVRAYVYARDGQRCAFCGSSENLHLDHIVPWSQGGGDDSSNLRPLCAPCNLSRGVKATGDDHTTRLPVALHCAECAPHKARETFGWCFTCGGPGEVAESQIDKCPDPETCGCMYWVVRKRQRDERRAQWRARKRKTPRRRR